MAEQLKISIPTYSRFERGLTKTNITLLSDVCKILELDESSINYPTKYNNPYEKFNLDGTTEEIYTQLNELITLLENQQAANEILLNKIKSLIKNKSL
jgi:transcriptional regulator with XRE-family HTH domain